VRRANLLDQSELHNQHRSRRPALTEIPVQLDNGRIKQVRRGPDASWLGDKAEETGLLKPCGHAASEHRTRCSTKGMIGVRNVANIVKTVNQRTVGVGRRNMHWTHRERG
jgi:hypothetical protein